MNRLLGWTIITAALFTAVRLPAATTVKTSGTTIPLNQAAAWSNGVPGQNDIALFDATSIVTGSTTAFNTGGNLNIGQVQMSFVSTTSDTQMNIDNNIVNLYGVNGIGINNLSYGTKNATLQFGFGATVVAQNSQVWNSINRQININGNIQGNSGITITKNGAGGLSLGGGVANLDFAGTFVFNGGNVTVNSRMDSLGGLNLNAGTTTLNFASTIIATSTNMLNSAATLGLGGGNLTFTGKASTVNAQTFNGLVLGNGYSVVALNNGGAGAAMNLNVGAITRNIGGLLAVTQSGAGTSTFNTSSGVTGQILKTSNGVAYAMVGTGTAANWATVDGSGNLVAYSGTYTHMGTVADLAGATAATDVSIDDSTTAGGASGTITGSMSIGTIKFSQTTASKVLNIAAGSTLAVGSILSVNSGSSGNSSEVGTGGGNLTALTGAHEVVLISQGAANINLNAIVTDNGEGSVSLTTGGQGTVNVQKQGTYTGDTIVASGILRMNSAGMGNANSEYKVAGNAQFNVNNQITAIGALSGNGVVALGNGANGQLTVGAKNTDTTFDGIISGQSNANQLIKVGTGVLRLTGYYITPSGTYSGTTTVNGGTLLVNGSMELAQGTIVNSGAKLGGLGAVSSLVVNNGGILTPGDGGIGAFKASSLTLTGNAGFLFDLSSVDNTSDLLNIGGAFTNGGSTGNYSFTFTGGTLGQTYTLMTFGSTDISGVSQFSSNLDGTFSISGNNLTFQLNTIPEPSTWLLLGAGGVILVISLWRRRKAAV